jgi:hypothetical protein
MAAVGVADAVVADDGTYPELLPRRYALCLLRPRRCHLRPPFTLVVDIPILMLHAAFQVWTNSSPTPGSSTTGNGQAMADAGPAGKAPSGKDEDDSMI